MMVEKIFCIVILTFSLLFLYMTLFGEQGRKKIPLGYWEKNWEKR
jgi:hypothetical protein